MDELNPEETTQVEREEVRKAAEREAAEARAAEAAGKTSEHPCLTSYLLKPCKGKPKPGR